MIPVKEALAAAVLEPDPATPPLTDEEEIQLDALDAAVESGILRTFNGRIFDMNVPASYVTPNVVAALRRRYEAPDAGWTTGVFVSAVDEVTKEPVELRLVFAPTISRVEVPAKESVVYIPAAEGGRSARLLVRLFARGKPHLTLNAVEVYREKAGMPIAIEVLVDKDDKATLASANMRRLIELDCAVTVGDFKTRGAAIAGGVVEDWDVLLVGGEDMIPVVNGYAAHAFSALLEKFPHLDGAVFFDDGTAHGDRCTLPVLGRRLVEHVEHVYAPEYREALYADHELTDILRARGRLVYVPEMIIENRAGDVDEGAVEADRAVYEARSAERRPHARVGFATPPLWLSVGIASLPARKARLDRLVAEIYRQVLAYAPGDVEVIVDDRAPPVVVGEKRQAILERARGHFIAFIDDDDWIAYDYIERIVGAIRENPEADCVGLRGAMTVFDRTETFETTIRQDAQDGVRVRRPNHLTPIRRLIALHAGFPAIDFGEDREYAERIAPYLKTEARAGDGVLYHYWYNPAVTP